MMEAPAGKHPAFLPILTIYNGAIIMAIPARAPFISYPRPMQPVFSASRPLNLRGEVLSVGRDEQLLLTRAGVLRTTGCEVISAYPEQVPALLEERQFNLVVIGHSLSDWEAAHLAFQSRNVSPLTKLLATCIDHRPQPVRQLFDAVVETWAGPAALVAAVRRLLTENCIRPN